MPALKLNWSDKFSYGGVPPIIVYSTIPSLPPLQDTFSVSDVSSNSSGSVIINSNTSLVQSGVPIVTE